MSASAHQDGSLPATQIDEHRIEPVADADRDSTAMHQFWIWAGANIAPINWILGALGIVLGLGLWDTILVLAVGNAIGVTLFGFFVLMGHRTGVSQMVLSRSAFGRRGAYLPAFLQAVIATGWVAINTWIVLDLVMELLDKIGIPTGDATRVIVVLTIMAIQVLIGIFGFYAIRTFEKWTVPATLVILLAMTIVAWTSGDVDWGFQGKAQGADRWTAMSQLMTAIGIGWGISWLAYASDYSRFVSRRVPERRLFTAAALGQFIPVLWLGVLGASIATTGTGADPATIIVNTFGTLSIPVLLLVIHGPIATNIVNIYSSSLSALTLDLKVARWKLSLVVGVIATAFTIWLAFRGDIAQQIDAWLVSLIMWISPWAAIMFVHFWILERGRVDVDGLYDPPHRSRVGDVRWAAVGSFLAGVVAAWLFQYGLVSVFQGPLSKALNNVDLSWLSGMTVAGGLYWTLERRRRRRARPVAPEAAPELETLRV